MRVWLHIREEKKEYKTIEERWKWFKFFPNLFSVSKKVTSQ